MSICRNHFDRIRAAREAETTPTAVPGATAPGTMADKMLKLIAMHRAALKAIKSRLAKIAAKATFLPEYTAYVDGVVAAGKGGQDDVLVTVMLWRLDTGDFEGALALAAYALRHDLAMPDFIARDLPTTVVEEIADAALAELDRADADTVNPEPIREALDLTAECDMPDEVRAKAHKALGLILTATAPEAALEHLASALELDAGCGVKTKLNALRKAQGKAEPNEKTEPTDPAGS
ncbi:Terminase, endonuclease subunit [uncultured Alphaproteobacteria bacterium]|uniref:Terminase, endonuclease subunit n=1 Tax=uncultured Alphaproteobacteria bacterium TaxID=91750 RepID=A0A212J476_9PROT|nr:Terminase, endonuclease subunit [uncultured Alphaproteobacteria bacterium]